LNLGGGQPGPVRDQMQNGYSQQMQNVNLGGQNPPQGQFMNLSK
jgi:hypothetical protein